MPDNNPLAALAGQAAVPVVEEDKSSALVGALGNRLVPEADERGTPFQRERAGIQSRQRAASVPTFHELNSELRFRALEAGEAEAVRQEKEKQQRDVLNSYAIQKARENFPGIGDDELSGMRDAYIVEAEDMFKAERKKAVDAVPVDVWNTVTKSFDERLKALPQDGRGGEIRRKMSQWYRSDDGRLSDGIKEYLFDSADGDAKTIRDWSAQLFSDRVAQLEKEPDEATRARQALADKWYEGSACEQAGYQSRNLLTGAARGILDLSGFLVTIEDQLTENVGRTIKGEKRRSWAEGAAANADNTIGVKERYTPEFRSSKEAELSGELWEDDKVAYIKSALSSAIRSTGEFLGPAVLTGGTSGLIRGAGTRVAAGAQSVAVRQAFNASTGGAARAAIAGEASAAAEFTAQALRSRVGRGALTYLDNAIAVTKSAYPSVFNNYYEQALQRGYKGEEAAEWAHGRAVTNIAIEAAGNPFQRNITGGAATTLLNGSAGRSVLARAANSRVGTILGKGLQEGAEEGTQGVTDHYQDFLKGKATWTESGGQAGIAPDEQFDWGKAMGNVINDVVVGSLAGVMMAGSGRNASMPNDPQAEALHYAATNGEAFAKSVSRLQKRGTITDEDAQKLQGFVARLASGVEQAAAQGFGPAKAARMALATARLQDLSAKALAETDPAKQKVLEEAAEQAFAQTQRITKNADVDGHLVSGEEMLEIAQATSPRVTPLQARRIVSAGPFETTDANPQDFAADPRVNYYLARLDDAEAASAQGGSTLEQGAADFSSQGQANYAYPVVDSNGKIIDGARRIAQAIAQGRPTIIVSRPLARAALAEQMREGAEISLEPTPDAPVTGDPNKDADARRVATAVREAELQGVDRAEVAIEQARGLLEEGADEIGTKAMLAQMFGLSSVQAEAVIREAKKPAVAATPAAQPPAPAPAQQVAPAPSVSSSTANVSAAPTTYTEPATAAEEYYEEGAADYLSEENYEEVFEPTFEEWAARLEESEARFAAAETDADRFAALSEADAARQALSFYDEYYNDPLLLDDFSSESDDARGSADGQRGDEDAGTGADQANDTPGTPAVGDVGTGVENGVGENAGGDFDAIAAREPESDDAKAARLLLEAQRAKPYTERRRVVARHEPRTWREFVLRFLALGGRVHPDQFIRASGMQNPGREGYLGRVSKKGVVLDTWVLDNANLSDDEVGFGDRGKVTVADQGEAVQEAVDLILAHPGNRSALEELEGLIIADIGDWRAIPAAAWGDASAEAELTDEEIGLLSGDEDLPALLEEIDAVEFSEETLPEAIALFASYINADGSFDYEALESDTIVGNFDTAPGGVLAWFNSLYTGQTRLTGDILDQQHKVVRNAFKRYADKQRADHAARIAADNSAGSTDAGGTDSSLPESSDVEEARGATQGREASRPKHGLARGERYASARDVADDDLKEELQDALASLDALRKGVPTDRVAAGTPGITPGVVWAVTEHADAELAARALNAAMSTEVFRTTVGDADPDAHAIAILVNAIGTPKSLSEQDAEILGTWKAHRGTFIARGVLGEMLGATAEALTDASNGQGLYRVSDVLRGMREFVNVTRNTLRQTPETAADKKRRNAAALEAARRDLRARGAGAVVESEDFADLEMDPTQLYADIVGDTRQQVVQRAFERAQSADIPPTRRVRVLPRLRRAVQALESGQEGAADLVADLHYRLEERAAEQALSPPADRARGADFIRQKLLEAKRRGDISAEAADFAEWFILQNPALAEDLGISVRQGDNTNRAGFYNPLARIITLIKGVDSDTTAVHEVLHHMERMMPADMQAAIRGEWSKAVAKAAKDPALRDYATDILQGVAGDKAATARARELVESGKVPYVAYALLSPSEFWAVRTTTRASARYAAAQGGIWSRIQNWLAEAVQHARGALGLSSDAPMLRALNYLLNEQTSGEIAQGTAMLDNAGMSERASILRANGVSQATQQKRAERFRLFFREWFTPGGGVSQAATELMEQSGGWTQRQMDAVTKLKKRAVAQMGAFGAEQQKRPAGQRISRATIEAAFARALDGTNGALALLPAEMQNTARSLRDALNALQEQFAKSGYASPRLKATIENTIGTYVARNYKMFARQKKVLGLFGGKHWSKEIPEKVRQRALEGITDWALQGSLDATIANDYQAALTLDAQAAANPALQPQAVAALEAVHARAQQAAEEFMQRMETESRGEGDNSFFVSPMGNRMKVKDFSQRKDLPLWYREYLGEVSDPIDRFMLTAGKLIRGNATAELQAQIRDLGLSTGDIIAPRDIKPKGFRTVGAMDGDPRFEMVPQGALNGHHLHPLLYNALFGPSVDASWYYSNVALRVKIGKVILSPVGIVKNAFSNKGFLLANGTMSAMAVSGVTNTGYVADAWKKLGGFTAYKQRVLDDAMKYGLVNSTDANEIRDYLGQASRAGAVEKAFQRNGLAAWYDLLKGDNPNNRSGADFMRMQGGRVLQGLGQGASAVGRGAQKFAEKAFAWGDIAPKVGSFEVWRNYYAKTVYDGRFYDLSPEQQEAASAAAAAHIKATMVTDSRVIKGASAIQRKVGILGTFPRFMVESHRTFYNTVGIASGRLKPATRGLPIRFFDDQAQNDAALKKIGKHTQLHTLTGLVGWAGLMQGLYAIAALALGDDDDNIGGGESPWWNILGDGRSTVWYQAYRMANRQEGDITVDEAVRAIVPNYSKNSQLLYKLRGDREIEVWDTGSNEPFNSVTSIGRAFLFGGTGATGDALKEAGKSVFGPEMFANAMFEHWANKDEYGREIYTPSREASDRYKDIFGHYLRKAAPGFVVSGMQIMRATDEQGKPLDEALMDQAEKALVGSPRTYKMDDVLRGAAYNTATALRSAKASMKRDLRTGDEQTAIDEEGMRIKARETAALYDLRRAATMLGLSEEDAQKVLGESGLSKDVRRAVLLGGDALTELQPFKYETE